MNRETAERCTIPTMTSTSALPLKPAPGSSLRLAAENVAFHGHASSFEMYVRPAAGECDVFIARSPAAAPATGRRRAIGAGSSKRRAYAHGRQSTTVQRRRTLSPWR